MGELGGHEIAGPCTVRIITKQPLPGLPTQLGGLASEVISPEAYKMYGEFFRPIPNPSARTAALASKQVISRSQLAQPGGRDYAASRG